MSQFFINLPRSRIIRVRRSELFWQGSVVPILCATPLLLASLLAGLSPAGAGLGIMLMGTAMYFFAMSPGDHERIRHTLRMMLGR